jgi:type II secretory pathway component PulL
MLSFPLLLYAAIGGGAAGLLARPRCAKLDARGASLALETALVEANAAAAAAARDAGAITDAAGAPEVQVLTTAPEMTLAWLALPQGKLYALADGTDDEVEASHLEHAQELGIGIGDEGDAAGQRDVPP